MRTVVRRQAELPVAREAGVLVCGGGPAGIGAAVASARSGVRTLLIEQYGFLGGMATAGMVLPFGDIDTPIARELFSRMAAYGGAKGWAFDPEAFKYEANELLLEAGAEPLFYTSVCEAIVENDVARGVVVHNKSGCQAVLGRVVIDCTGDADVAASAGAPFTKGREQDGLMQPVTLMFRLGGVDLEKYRAYEREDAKMEKALAQARAAGEIARHTCSLMGFVQVPGRNEFVLNLSNSPQVDGTNGDDLTKAAIETRREVHRIVAALKRHVPGFEDSYLIDTAPHVGVRETRQAVGEYVFTEEDVVEARKFDDAVARNTFEIDVHPLDGVGRARHSWGKLRTSEEKWVDIPYRCLVPLKVDNLLVAGRCFSATHEGMSAPRRMGPCMAMGQAAGTAAALAIKHNVAPRQLDVKELQRALREQGAEI